MLLIDTHCHINFDSYDADRDAVIERAAWADVTQIINPAVDLETSRAAIVLAAQYTGIYAAVGVHPNSTADFNPGWIDEFATLAAQPKVVAIGEIGLDYHWDESPKEKQFEAFEAQLVLAAKLELPVIIHNREARPLVQKRVRLRIKPTYCSLHLRHKFFYLLFLIFSTNQ